MKQNQNLIIKEYQLVLKINFPFQWGFLLWMCCESLYCLENQPKCFLNSFNLDTVQSLEPFSIIILKPRWLISMMMTKLKMLIDIHGNCFNLLLSSKKRRKNESSLTTRISLSIFFTMISFNWFQLTFNYLICKEFTVNFKNLIQKIKKTSRKNQKYLKKN